MNPTIDEPLYGQLSDYITAIYESTIVQSIDLVIQKDCIYFKLLCSNNTISCLQMDLQTLRNKFKELDNLVNNFVNFIEL